MDIKGVIKEHGFTLVQVAQKMEISKGGISQIVNGSPTVKTLRPSFKCPYCGHELHIEIK